MISKARSKYLHEQFGPQTTPSSTSTLSLHVVACHAILTVAHLLARRELRAKVGSQCDNLSHLLGRWPGTGDGAAWKPDINAVKATVRFKRTGRFEPRMDTN
jgi:hypothetical protein